MFTVDGMEWTFPCDISRVSEMTASEISGMLLNKNYFNDVIGTFLKYTITLVVPFGGENEYVRLYELLTDPVDGHAFVLPYNASTINLTGRVQNISDVYKRLADGTIHWKGIKFDVVSNSPNKTHTLGEAISRGVAPVPDVAEPEAGTAYEYDGSQWVPVSLTNADDTPY